MSNRRWYPTNTTLADGRVLVTSGQAYATAAGVAVQGPPEVYSDVSNSWQVLSNAARPLPLYPWMFQGPDGRVFNAGPNPDAKFLNPTAATIGSTAAGAWDATTYNTLLGLQREYGSAVLYAPGKVLIVGGSTNTSAGVTNTAECIDLGAAAPLFQTAGAMQYARTHVNATLLADGTVLATGGSSTRSISEADAILPAELWTPPATGSGPGTWTMMNAMSVPRLYHSTAVLLPDATVLTTGGGQGGGYKDHPDYQIFTPPYLCKGLARPEISTAPQAVAYGQSFVVSSPQAGSILGRGGRVTLVRLSSVTHAFNMNQRFMELSRTAGLTSNDITLSIPNNPNGYPPGHYLLFLIDVNGTPSHASIIAINATACAAPLTITQVSPSESPANACTRTTQFTVSGGSPGNTYDWVVNGSNYYNQGPATIDVYTSTSAPTAQVTVSIHNNAGCGASSTLTSYFPGCTEAQ